MKKAVIIGHGYSALGVIHTLASEGVPVVYLSTAPERNEFTHFSRHASQLLRVPFTEDGSRNVLDLLLNAEKDWDGALLLPTTDRAVSLISRNRGALTQRYVTAVPDWDVISKIRDKRTVSLHAEKVGVPTPAFVIPDSVEALEERSGEFRYPCILKPVDPSRFVETFSCKLFVVENHEELIARYKEALHHGLELMVSEIIPGDDSQFFHYRSYIDGNGNLLAEICTQKLQQIPPGFGVARVSRTVPMMDTLRVHTLDLLRSFHYRGVSSAEYKYDERDRRYKLIEINSRSVVPELLFAEAGVNFAHVSYLDLVEDVRQDVPAYDPDVYWVDQFGEFYEMVRAFAGGKPAFRDYFWPYRKQRKVFSVPFFKDPMPALVRTADHIKMLTKGIFRRLVNAGRRDVD